MKNFFKLSVYAVIALIAGLVVTSCSSLPRMEGSVSISVQGGGAAEPGKTLVAAYTGSETVSYQWKRGFINLGTETSQLASEPGDYTVTVSAEGFRRMTSPVMKVAYPDLSGNITISVQGGGTAEPGKTLVAAYTGSETVSYQWKRGSTNLGTTASQLASEAGSYTVTVSATGFTSKTSAAINVVETAVAATPEPAASNAYVITGSGTSFSASKGGAAVTGASGAIQTVVDAIRTDANGAAITIQFGDGTAPLNIGDGRVDFNNTGGTWGNITISGKILANSSSRPFVAVTFSDGVSGTSTADITETATNSQALEKNGVGTLTITGGTITGQYAAVSVADSTGYRAIVNVTGGTIIGRQSFYISGGTVNISSGTITASILLINSGTALNVSGGTITATGSSNHAISTWGRVNLTGNATITSADTRADGGTIRVMGGHLSGDPTLRIASSVRLTNTGGGAVVYINPSVTTARIEGWPR